MNIGFRIYTDFERPSADLVEQFREFATSNISDNMNRFGCLDWKIKPMNMLENIKLAGTAITVKTRMVDNLMVQKAIDVASPGDVIVVDTSENTSNAVVGEIMCRYAASKGIAGFIIDGLVRDIGVLRKMTDIIIYATGTTPQGPHQDGPGEINVPIACGGCVINPGDIIVGDEDGIVVVKPHEAQELISKVKKTMAKETAMLSQIKQGTLERAWVDEKLAAKGCQIFHGKYSG